jgi:hypothetical protein
MASPFDQIICAENALLRRSVNALRGIKKYRYNVLRCSNRSRASAPEGDPFNQFCEFFGKENNMLSAKQDHINHQSGDQQ